MNSRYVYTFPMMTGKKHNAFFMKKSNRSSLQHFPVKKQLTIFMMAMLLLTLFSSITFAQFVSPGTLAQFVSPGKLTASHKELAGIKNCIKCHSLGKGIPDAACTACHEKLVLRIKENKGFHATIKDKCVFCHKDHLGEDQDITSLNKKTFNHKDTGYVLQDSHNVDCNKCHKKEKTFLGLSQECLTCHTDVHKKTLSQDCRQCHNFAEWKIIQFEHNKFSKYSLIGKHADAKCEGCHPEEIVSGGMTDAGKTFKVMKLKDIKSDSCNDCHADVHKGKLKQKTCAQCHSPEEWKKTAFEHNNASLSDYQLIGKHKKAACELCHPVAKIEVSINGAREKKKVRQFKGIEHGNCSNCHYDVHKEQFKDKSCDSCHSLEKGWKEFTFRHDSEDYKGYKLAGKHKETDCEKCHEKSNVKYKEFDQRKKLKIGSFTGIKSERCTDCHYDVHKEQFKDKSCDSCHSLEKGWKEFTFRHDSEDYKGYKLAGKHKEADCEKCHEKSNVKYKEFDQRKKLKIGSFTGIKSEQCTDCHYDIHKEQFKDKSCDSCHSLEKGWKEFTFRHESNDYKGYKLEGKHRDVSCEKCHKRDDVIFKEFNTSKSVAVGTFKFANSECASCHKDEHNGKYDQPCSKCHVPADWKPKDFIHDPISFELEGAHRAIPCEKCHASDKIYTGLTSDCAVCHKDNHPNQFAQTCTECHKQNAWVPVDFGHSGVGFRLSGTHKTLDCKECHTNAIFQDTPTDCYTCHQDDYGRAPNHSDMSYSHDCTECHRQSGSWEDATYEHTSFEFRGAHAALKNNCSSCHGSAAGKALAGTSDEDCYKCHSSTGVASSSYELTSTPSHASSGFSTDCASCHTVTTWAGASFTHGRFQMRGIHGSLSCNQCHTDGQYPGQIAGTTDGNCYACHESLHNAEHPSFPQDCTGCHSLSTWTGATYNHSSFQLEGVHASLSCNQCHTDGQYPGQIAGTTNDNCYACHASQHASHHPTVSQDCMQCHAENTWTGASFTH
ncbi:MAG: hypothetical protein AMK70_07315, partial [Nitrospira bacterium SG8_35_1]